MRTDAVIDHFLRWTGLNRKAGTLKSYTQLLKLFRAEFGAREFRGYDPERQPADDPLVTFTPLEIEEFLARIHAGPTRRATAVVLTRLQNWAVSKRLMTEGQRIFSRLEKPAGGKRERVPTADELRRLLEQASPEFVRIHDALCRCGARPGEICGLQIPQVDFAKRLITIAEHKTSRKTGKDRLIPIADKLEHVLRQAIGGRTAGPVFLTPRGRAWTATHLSATHKALARKAGLGEDFVLYLTRHRFGTELCRLGKDIKIVSTLMGHEDIATTQRYQHPNVLELGGLQDEIE